MPPKFLKHLNLGICEFNNKTSNEIAATYIRLM